MRQYVTRLLMCGFLPKYFLSVFIYSAIGDIHTLTGGWGPKGFPLCVGHEIVGEVITVGALVTLCKVGDRVGVGAQVLSCFDCKACKTGNENYCAKRIGTITFLSMNFVIISNAPRPYV